MLCRGYLDRNREEVEEDAKEMVSWLSEDTFTGRTGMAADECERTGERGVEGGKGTRSGVESELIFACAMGVRV